MNPESMPEIAFLARDCQESQHCAAMGILRLP